MRLSQLVEANSVSTIRAQIQKLVALDEPDWKLAGSLAVELQHKGFPNAAKRVQMAATDEDPKALAAVLQELLAEFPVQADVPKTTIEVWQAALDRHSKGLNLSDPEDRSIFRMRVTDATKNAVVGLIRDLAKHFGGKPKDTSRAAAVRALADAWISKHH